MKLINLVRARNIIGGYAQQKVSGALAYKMFKFIKSTESEETFYSDRFKEIINQYGEKDKDGNLIFNNATVSLIPETANICKNEISELENTEVEMQACFTVTEISELKISAGDIFKLEDLIKEE